MIRLLSSFIGPAVFVGAYAVPMLETAERLSHLADAVAGKVEARTSPEVMLESIRSGRTLREAAERLPANAALAGEFLRIGMRELDVSVLEAQSLSPLIQEQVRRHREVMETISGFLRQEQNGLSR
jgi:hypothetical protein